ncbi:MAG: DUF4417 domain-containing protein [Deltaproteobacteria bacterium]|nr:DUF4417 domain-containing protein [Deltaproteobacteria bacterium]
MKLYRLDGETISVGCSTCPLFQDCGGYTRRGGGWSCMDRCAACTKSCNLVCVKKPDFARALLEVGGFRHDDIPQLPAPKGPLPQYIPVVQHPIDGCVPLDWAVIPLVEIMRFDRGAYAPRAATPDELRRAFGLAPTTRLVLLGTGRDRGIETYWRHHRVSNAATALAELDLTLAIAPNYSMFLEDPRPQHLHNRKRSLLVAKSWAEAGIAVSIYPQAVSPLDWSFHESFLREHPEVVHVALEFQTGLARPERATFAFDHLSRIQDRLGRRLHLFAVGASRYREELPKRFDTWTILDSMPFMKAVKRRVAASIDRRIGWDRALGEDVADLFFHNVGRYTEWIRNG